MNILMPTDFSENARNAARYALQFFQDIPCTFHFLHVLTLPAAKLGHPVMAMPGEVQQKFKLLLAELEKLKTNYEHVFLSSYKADYFIEAIRDQVKEKQIDLILMGTRGNTNKSEHVVGKHTADVMMKVKCPALAISEKAIFKAHREVLFPTDYKIHYSPKMLDTLFNIIRLSRAKVKILELYNSDKEPTAEQIANRLFLQNSFSPEILKTQAFYPLRQTEKNPLIEGNEKVDMVVMAARNLNLCQRLLRNQSADQIPLIRQLPLLIIHG